MTAPYGGYDGRYTGPGPEPAPPERPRHWLGRAVMLMALALVSGTVIACLLLVYYPDQATAAAVWELGATADGIPLVPVIAGIVLLYLVCRAARRTPQPHDEEF
jgi:hypothetical protein